MYLSEVLCGHAHVVLVHAVHDCQSLVDVVQVFVQLVGGHHLGIGVRVGGGFVDGAGHDQSDVGARLPQHGRHLFRPHAPHVHVTDLQQVVPAEEATVLEHRGERVNSGADQGGEG